MKHVDKIQGYVENDQFHSAVAYLNQHKSAATIPAVYRVIHGALERMHDEWPRSGASEARRTKYRDLAVLHTMVSPRMPIFEYPDGVPIGTKGVQADDEDTRVFERHQLENQESSITICFCGPNAKIAAQRIAHLLERGSGDVISHLTDHNLELTGIKVSTK